MTQTERIRYMEEILDDAADAALALLAALERYRAIGPRVAELEAYYTSPRWLKDYDDDRAGRLPADLKRGVLSEDAVYDFLCMKRELEEKLKE